MDADVEFTRTQWAVGQGFFHSGEVTTHGGSVLHVYDCGSLDANALQNEIRVFFREHNTRVVDIVHVSHYHFDHVSGLEHLLRTVGARTVVIPVIEPIERLVAICKTAPAGAIRGWPLEFAADPVAALRRIVKDITIVQVAPTDGDADDDEPDLEVDDGLRDGLDDGGGDDGSPNLELSPGVSLRVGATSVLESTGLSGERLVLWTWIAYTTKFAAKKRAALLEALVNDPSISELEFALAMQDADEFYRFAVEHHDAIAAAFRETFADLNLSSLLLYSGPPARLRTEHRWSWRYVPGSRPSRDLVLWQAEGRTGWVGTGDQHMGARRCGEVEKRFHHVLDRVGTLTLPHHGARSSYHSNLLKMFPAAKPTCVVSAGRANQFGHPVNDVLMDVAAQGGSIVLVNDASGSRFSEGGYLTY